MKYTVQIEIADNWIEDGFTLTPEKLVEAIRAHCLPHAYAHEVKAEMKS